jgi:hypothetical protein
MDNDLAPDNQDAPGSDDRRLPLRAEQEATASGQAQQAMLRSGIQHVHFGDRERPREPVVSVAPPVGQRDEQLPVRGRDQILAEIAGSAAHVWVVHGLGGCGKTRLALEVAFQAHQDGVTVWWVSAADPGSLVTGMRAVGRRLGVSDTELEHGDATDVIWQHLMGRADRWLLILDNADDPQILTGAGRSVAEGRGWLRPVPGQGGRVLVTSRDGRATSWGAWCHRHRLGVLPPGEAAAVLADHADHHPDLGSQDDVRRLAVRLGGLPLALKIAGAYLADAAAIPHAFAEADQIRSYEQYLNAVEGGDFDSVFPAAGQDMTQEQARELIGRTWDLSLDLLDARQLSEARPLLRFLASLADAPIPYETLLKPAGLAVWPTFEALTGSRLWQVLQALDGFGLIDLDISDDQTAIPVIRLHPLVRDTSRPGAEGGDRPALLGLAARLLQKAATKDAGFPSDPATWPIWQLLSAHAVHVFETLMAEPACPDDVAMAAASAAFIAAIYQAEQGLDAEALAEFRNVLTARRRVLGPDHPDTLDAWYYVPYVVGDMGDHATALTEYRDLLAAQRRVLGPNHPDMLTTRHDIAFELGRLGDHAAALAEFRDVLAARQRALGPEHPATLTTRDEMAGQMADLGDFVTALAERRDVLAAELRVLGPDHPDTLITRYCIAVELGKLGDHAAALAELRELRATESRVLGPDHPSALITRRQIAVELGKLGDDAAALAELRELRATESRVLGPDHPEALITRRQIAVELGKLGDDAAALAELREVLAVQQRVLGPDHPSTKATANRLHSMEHHALP